MKLLIWNRTKVSTKHRKLYTEKIFLEGVENDLKLHYVVATDNHMMEKYTPNMIIDFRELYILSISVLEDKGEIPYESVE